MTPEARVKTALLRWIAIQRKNGVPIHAFKVAGGFRQQAGQPDLIICYDGNFCAVEVKRPGEDATPLQQHRLKEWQAAGAIVGVVNSVEELKKLLADESSYAI